MIKVSERQKTVIYDLSTVYSTLGSHIAHLHGQYGTLCTMKTRKVNKGINREKIKLSIQALK